MFAFRSVALAALAVTAVPLHAQPAVVFPIGFPLGAGDDTITNVFIPFSFDCPGGVSTSFLSIDSNGRIFPGGADSSDFTEAEIELLCGPCVLAPFWDDLTLEGDGDIHYFATATEARITWKDATAFGDTERFTFQVTMRPDGTFTFAYCENIPEDGIVGYSDGSCPVGDVVDWSDGPVTTTGAGYEIFYGADFDLAATRLDFAPNGPDYDTVPTVSPLFTATYSCVETPGFYGAPTLSIEGTPRHGEELCIRIDNPSPDVSGWLGIAIGPTTSIQIGCTLAPYFTYCLDGTLLAFKPITFVSGTAKCCFPGCDPSFNGLNCFDFQALVFDTTSINTCGLPLTASQRMTVK